MESQNIEFRAVIMFLTKEGAKAKEIHRRMADVYGDSSPKYSTVAKWSAEFNPYLAFRDNSRAGGGLSTQKPVILTIYHMQPFRASVPIQE